MTDDDLRLVIFDVDGTLVDSQSHIVASMERAFAAQHLPPPSRSETLSIVGLSLPQAMARLVPERPDHVAPLVAAYKADFADLRHSGDGAALSPLYPGAREALQAMARQVHMLLAVATGKSRRGLTHVFDLHGLHGVFHSVQCADDHPSKPHPSMVWACLRDTGVSARDAVLLGDTTFDMEMAGAARIKALGVEWGYHRPDALRASGAQEVLADYSDLPAALARLWGVR